jgi:hypothetical protein
MGRRMSLGVESLIAVSAAGCPKGAWKKAARFGILVRDLCPLTDMAGLHGGRSVALTLLYSPYSDRERSLLFDSARLPRCAENRLKEARKSSPGLQALGHAAAAPLDTLHLLWDERVGHTATFRLPCNEKPFASGMSPWWRVSVLGRPGAERTTWSALSLWLMVRLREASHSGTLLLSSARSVSVQ